MAVLLRDMGVPTRMVEGFLPGTRDASGAERILNSNAHAWVEVYFPGYGWVTFDPTGANLRPRSDRCRRGTRSSASPSASGSARPIATIREREIPPGDPGGVGAPGAPAARRPGRSSR